MKIRKRFLGLAAVALTAVTAHAGADDFGVWTDLGVTKTLPYGVSLSLGGGMRTMNNSRDIDRWSGSFGVGYKPVKYVKLGASYSFLYQHKLSERKEHYRQDIVHPLLWNGYNVTEHYWAPKNRFSGDVTGELKIYRILKLSLRERYQFTNRKAMEIPRTKYRYKKDQKTLKNGYPLNDFKEKDRKRTQYLRSRLKAEIDKKGWKLKPFVAFELYNDLDDELVLDKTRFTLGGTYKVKKRHEFSMAYVFGNEVDEEPYEGQHVVNIGYSFKF